MKKKKSKRLYRASQNIRIKNVFLESVLSESFPSLGVTVQLTSLGCPPTRCRSLDLLWGQRTTPSLTDKPGRPQSTGSQRVENNWRDPVCIDVRLFFACGSSAPGRVEHQDGTAACDTGTKAALSVQGHGLLNLQELWPHQSFFEHLVAGDQKASLAKSFSVALPIQALRGPPCLWSFSAVGHIRHIEGPPRQEF